MRLSFYKYILIFCVFTPKLFNAQDIEAKLKKAYSELKYDKTVNDSLKTYKTIIFNFSQSNLDSSKYYFNKAYPLTKRATNAALCANIYEVLANAYWYSNDFKNAMNNYLIELRIGDSINNKAIIADSKYNIGWIKCLQLKQYKAVNYFYEALDIFLLQKDSIHIIQLYQALGNYYKENKDRYKFSDDSCLKYFTICIDLFKGSTFENKASTSYINLAEYYTSKNQFIKAKEYALKGLSLAIIDNDEYNYVYSASILAVCYVNVDSLAQAKKIIKTIESKLYNIIYEPNRLNMYYAYLNIYKKEKKFEKAFEYSVKYKNLSDSINEKIFNENLLQKESDYTLEKKDKELSELQLNNQLQAVKNKNNSYIIWSLGIFGCLILFILYFLFKSNKQKQNTNTLLSSQNEIINQKNIEIQQSMQYAKGIQQALLPSSKYITAQLNRLKNKKI